MKLYQLIILIGITSSIFSVPQEKKRRFVMSHDPEIKSSRGGIIAAASLTALGSLALIVSKKGKSSDEDQKLTISSHNSLEDNKTSQPDSAQSITQPSQDPLIDELRAMVQNYKPENALVDMNKIDNAINCLELTPEEIPAQLQRLEQERIKTAQEKEKIEAEYQALQQRLTEKKKRKGTPQQSPSAP